MTFPTEVEYFAGRAVTCRAAGRAATDRAVAFAHRELARRYDLLTIERAHAADAIQIDTATRPVAGVGA